MCSLSFILGDVACDASTDVVVQVLSNQLHVVISSHEKPDKWALDEKVCLFRRDEQIACGLVIQQNAKTAVVKLTEQNKIVKLGDTVQGPDNSRKAASDCPPSICIPPPAQRRHILLGANSSLQTTFYFAHFQGYIAEAVSLGISPGLLKTLVDGTSVTTYGVFFTANYYRGGPFRGLWVQAGSGLYAFSVTSGNLTETSVSPAILATIGWRSYWALDFNIGIGFGIRYVTLPQRAIVPVGFPSFQPIVSVDIGWDF